MSSGAVDWVVLEFPGSKFNGSIAPVINDLTDRGLIRVLDLIGIKTDEDGNFEAFEAEDVEDGELGAPARSDIHLVWLGLCPRADFAVLLPFRVRRLTVGFVMLPAPLFAESRRHHVCTKSPDVGWGHRREHRAGLRPRQVGTTQISGATVINANYLQPLQAAINPAHS